MAAGGLHARKRTLEEALAGEERCLGVAAAVCRAGGADSRHDKDAWVSASTEACAGTGATGSYKATAPAGALALPPGLRPQLLGRPVPRVVAPPRLEGVPRFLLHLGASGAEPGVPVSLAAAEGDAKAEEDGQGAALAKFREVAKAAADSVAMMVGTVPCGSLGDGGAHAAALACLPGATPPLLQKPRLLPQPAAAGATTVAGLSAAVVAAAGLQHEAPGEAGWEEPTWDGHPAEAPLPPTVSQLLQEAQLKLSAQVEAHELLQHQQQQLEWQLQVAGQAQQLQDLELAQAQFSAEVEGQHQQVATQMYLLAQLAEECAQMAASAAACCATSESDPAQATSLTQAAQQAAQRANWAATTLASTSPAEGGQVDEWTASLQQIAKQAAEAADHAARNCRLQASDITSRVPVSTVDKKSKVPCKWFLTGQCRRGSTCEFSHDLVDLQPRPLHKKRAEECIYFQQGRCTRGTACPFAHGADELAEVSRIVSDLKTERRLFSRTAGRH
mmetsp:Transcript_6762/g.21015  ORF Transcript_6762/g.21015 Transcript_6762/m.21015 type:complete len:503 (+) Transcript_6762:97-1605(+)